MNDRDIYKDGHGFRPISQGGPKPGYRTKLTWNKVSDTEWQAGGLGSLYTIRKTEDTIKPTHHQAHYSLFRTSGDGPEAYVTSSGAIDYVKDLAQTLCDGQTK